MQKSLRTWFIVVVLLALLLALTGSALAQNVGLSDKGSGVAEKMKTEAPVEVKVEWQAKMPEPPADACPECDLDKVNRTIPPPQDMTSMQMKTDFVAPDLPQTLPQPPGSPQAASDFYWHKKHKLTDSEAPSVSNVCEPTAAISSPKVLYTGNWFAAKSSNYGGTFTYVNPYTVFTPPSGMTFCCDQEVVYDRTRDIFIWSLLYITPDVKGGCNRLAISKDLSTWWYYDFNYSTTLLPDYPHLRLSDNYLYLTTNIFGPTGWTQSRLQRFPLTELSLKKGFTYYSLARTDVFNLVMAKNRFQQGTAFFVSNWLTTSPQNRIRIFQWPESRTTYSYSTVTVTSWNFGGFSCTTADGRNPCGRMDARLLGAVITNWGGAEKTLWLSWNAGPMTGRPKVYTYVVKINVANNTVLGYADIYNTSYTWGYNHFGVNDLGHLGFSVNAMGSTQYVSSYVGLYDNYTPAPPPGWQVWLSAQGLAGPSDAKWGDYNWCDQYFPYPNMFVGTGHVKPSSTAVDPYFYLFGRYGNRF